MTYVTNNNKRMPCQCQTLSRTRLGCKSAIDFTKQPVPFFEGSPYLRVAARCNTDLTSRRIGHQAFALPLISAPLAVPASTLLSGLLTASARLAPTAGTSSTSRSSRTSFAQSSLVRLFLSTPKTRSQRTFWFWRFPRLVPLHIENRTDDPLYSDKNLYFGRDAKEQVDFSHGLLDHEPQTSEQYARQWSQWPSPLRM